VARFRSASWLAVLGLAVATTAWAAADRDGDGVSNAVDACPKEVEDFDGFRDRDGCPEPDNDGDGVLDYEDACRDVAGQLGASCPEGPPVRHTVVATPAGVVPPPRKQDAGEALDTGG